MRKELRDEINKSLFQIPDKFIGSEKCTICLMNVNLAVTRDCIQCKNVTCINCLLKQVNNGKFICALCRKENKI